MYMNKIYLYVLGSNLYEVTTIQKVVKCDRLLKRVRVQNTPSIRPFNAYFYKKIKNYILSSFLLFLYNHLLDNQPHLKIPLNMKFSGFGFYTLKMHIIDLWNVCEVWPCKIKIHLIYRGSIISHYILVFVKTVAVQRRKFQLAT